MTLFTLLPGGKHPSITPDPTLELARRVADRTAAERVFRAELLTLSREQLIQFALESEEPARGIVRARNIKALS